MTVSSKVGVCSSVNEDGVCAAPVCACGGFSLKERYRAHRQACKKACEDIERHDPKMAKSARKLLSVRQDDI
jgi:hypothetical protein